jgi:hypothetical protein
LFLKIKVFLSINIYSLKSLKFGFKTFSCVFLIFFVLHYIISIFHIFLGGLMHISQRMFFVKVRIVKVVIGLMAKYHLGF